MASGYASPLLSSSALDLENLLGHLFGNWSSNPPASGLTHTGLVLHDHRDGHRWRLVRLAGPADEPCLGRRRVRTDLGGAGLASDVEAGQLRGRTRPVLHHTPHGIAHRRRALLAHGA